ncbi:hypothetical protein NX862_14230 [Rhodobacter sp. KR11]|uniref:DUF6880 family protein n=1 Tax=Rhodobacter sp. KR11 TaxID=2974588 RepID=UPI002222C641|nr:DUF6880 family protein [Rhodobacter sp. KR11]MCW1919914.1 hypothetical protein [Rhodobacter sp. KR11]
MASKTTLNAANLQGLGAERLAELLIEISTGSALAKRRLRLELAGAQSPKEAAREISKRLTTLATARARITWRSRKTLVADLSGQLQAIEQLVPADPTEALALTWRFLQVGTPLFQRCEDTNGTVRAVFAQGCALLGRIAPRDRPEALADAVLDAVQDNEGGQYDGLIAALAEALGPVGLLHLKTRLQDEKGPLIRQALQEVADVTGDVDAFVAQTPVPARRDPLVALQIAQRLAAQGRDAEALAFLDQAQGRPGADAVQLRLHLLERLGRQAEAQDFRLALFHRDLDAPALRAYLKKLPDFEDITALDLAMDHVTAYPVAWMALQFLLDWPDHDRAARLILTRRVELDGDRYDILAPAAEALASRAPLAATLALRAMIDFTLRAGRSSRYGHAARHLSLCAELAPHIADFGPLPTHAAYEARLRHDHPRKAGFWTQSPLRGQS